MVDGVYIGVMGAEKKKRGRPPKDGVAARKGDRHTQPRKVFHAPQSLFDALEAYIRDTNPPPTEAATLRAALEGFLKERGYWPPK